MIEELEKSDQGLGNFFNTKPLCERRVVTLARFFVENRKTGTGQDLEAKRRGNGCSNSVPEVTKM